MLTGARYTAPWSSSVNLTLCVCIYAVLHEEGNKQSFNPLQKQDRSNPGQQHVTENLLGIGEQK